MSLIMQEVSTEREIEIPEPVRDVYRQWRPSPLYRARRLEQALQTPARIYYKYEGVSPAGSHKPNTAVAQAFYNKEAGVRKITTETGAGQWGSSLAFAGALFGIDDSGLHGARVVQPEAVSPCLHGNLRRALHRESVDGDQLSAARCWRARRTVHGSLGIAISEAVEVAATHDDTKYALGSVLNHVLLHQTVIGQEAIAQMEMANDYPDIVVGCTGGGSNFAGIAFPFIGAAAARRTEGPGRSPSSRPRARASRAVVYAYDFGDTGRMTPLAKMHTLGSAFVPPGFHAGGLRYHGMAPLVSHVKQLGLIEARAPQQIAVLRGRRPVRESGRHRAGARGEPRGEGRHRRGHPLQG